VLSTPETLAAAHDVSTFSCGSPTLDHWLKARGRLNQEKGFTAVVVVHEAGRVAGYYGLTTVAVVPSILPRDLRAGQLSDPVPCLLLGQLATDTAWASQGIATGLLKHALDRCVQLARLNRAQALMVNAVDEDAAAFWRRRGFIESRDEPLILLRTIADIAALLSARQL